MLSHYNKATCIFFLLLSAKSRAVTVFALPCCKNMRQRSKNAIAFL